MSLFRRRPKKDKQQEKHDSSPVTLVKAKEEKNKKKAAQITPVKAKEEKKAAKKESFRVTNKFTPSPTKKQFTPAKKKRKRILRRKAQQIQRRAA